VKMSAQCRNADLPSSPSMLLCESFLVVLFFSGGLWNYDEGLVLEQIVKWNAPEREECGE
jgi:hypothetical protein